MNRISEYIKWFLYITTGILIVCAANLEIMGEETIQVDMLWQILLSGLLTTLVTVLLFIQECNRKAEVCLKCILHYVALCVIMVLCGNWFGWMKLDLGGIVMMVVSVAVVYLFAFLAYYLIDMRQAVQINQKLKEKYGDEE